MKNDYEDTTMHNSSLKGPSHLLFENSVNSQNMGGLMQNSILDSSLINSPHLPQLPAIKGSRKIFMQKKGLILNHNVIADLNSGPNSRNPFIL